MKSSQSKIIGGVFAIEFPAALEKKNIPFIPNDKPAVFLNTARAGIYYLVDKLKPGAIWMPSFLCGSMLECISHRQGTIRFYPVDQRLDIDNWSWLNAVKRGDIVCIIDYFGYHSSTALKRKIRTKGAVLLEDACQSMLTSGIGKDADYLLFSPRKFVGVADGGILVGLTDGEKIDEKLPEVSIDWWMTIFGASFLRCLFDHQYSGDDDRRWFELHQQADQSVPHGAFAMSRLSRALLDCSFDYDEIGKKRIQNFGILYERLHHLSLLPEPEPGTVPLGFVIKLRNRKQRDDLRSFLFSKSIYPPIHWQVEGVVPSDFKESISLSKTVMTIPCDQRYGEDDMKRVSTAISEWSRHANYR